MAVWLCPPPIQWVQAEKVPCPAGSGRAKRDPAAGCTGFTIDAEIYKPAKAPPAPVPQPARPAKQQQQQQVAGKKPAGPTGGVAAGRKHRPIGSSSCSNPQPYGAAAAGSGSRPPGRPPPFAPAAAAGGSGGSGFFKGPRPPELTLCREVAEAGRCYIRNCRFAHSEEELQQREEEYAAERAARWQQAREEEEAAQRAAAQRALEEASAAQAVLDAIEEREMLLGVSQPTLALVKGHKRAACLHTLLAYGFGEEEAANAVEAAGADQRLATQMLFNQEPCTGFQPVTIDREIQDLLSFAAELGLPSPLQAVEDQLVAADGNWEAAHEALQAAALEAAAAAASPSAAVADAGSWGAEDWGTLPSAAQPPEAHEPAQQQQQLYAQPEQLQQPYSPRSPYCAYPQQQQYGTPSALAPEAFFPATQPQPWHQQPGAQPPSPHYQQVGGTPFQQLPPHMAHEQGPQTPPAAPEPQHAQHAEQGGDDLDAMLSLMGIG
ncbi:hypothetical protein C2E21_8417 [Chlorella sorokiniana]|uniref:C3H1-type domain-containing protein n=1 Tax=Chlorella sorokiniana TaxID=3076 RepID=A0A2P6TEE2_CHLSO|nr:hypothetical protein C2E21_8417 [Chlorella sorokiniana]|eukprot:PRW21015.1 hypothetical protein C2E21_8417 [Chlorella sorokiniana]